MGNTFEKKYRTRKQFVILVIVKDKALLVKYHPENKYLKT